MRHSEPDQAGVGRKCQRCVIYRPLVVLSLAIAACIFLSGCGVTLSPVKRAPVQISPVRLSQEPNSQAITVEFESTLPNEPLVDTLWDNVAGPFADPHGSKYIGYIQDYSKMAAASGGYDDDLSI